MTRLSIRLLGSLQVELDGEPVAGFISDKARALLAYLAVEGEKSHRRETLAGLLWPDFAERSARKSLRNALANVRQVIHDRDASPPFLHVSRQAVQFNGASDSWIDVTEFAALAADWTVNKASDQQAIQHLERAIALYRGSLLEGFSIPDSTPFEEWLLLKREQLQRQTLSALKALVACYESCRDYEEALHYAWRQVEIDPFRETGQRALMRLLSLDDQREAALVQFENLRHLLAEELGIEPSQDTVRLYEQIRAGELEVGDAEHAGRAEFPPGEDRSVTERPVFVGRERELARLSSHLKAALAGRGKVVFITGGPGRGKTALMHEFAWSVMRSLPELLVVAGNGVARAGVGDPYLPFRQVLGLLTGDVESHRAVPGLFGRQHARRLWDAVPLTAQALLQEGPDLINTLVPGPALVLRARAHTLGGVADADWLARLGELVEQRRINYDAPQLQQTAIFEQYTRVLKTLARHQPLLLLLDDLQWADNGSIGLLFHLGRQMAGARILVIAAYRPEEIALESDGEQHRLSGVVGEFKRRFGDVGLDLTQADKTEGRQFVEALLDTEPYRLGDGFREALFQRTGGHPLFTVEILRTMREWGELVRDEKGLWVEGPELDWTRLPARVQAVIEARVDRLDEKLRQMLSVASVEGEEFTAQNVAFVLGISEIEALRLLSHDLGKRQRLVRERGEVQIGERFLTRYRFAHALYQEYAYRATSGGERRLLHSQIASALEMQYGDQSAEIAAQLAHHYALAGQREKTIEFSVRAGDQARRAYANEEAMAHYQKALEMLRSVMSSLVSDAQADWQLAALKGLGEVQQRIGNAAQAEALFREAIALGKRLQLPARKLARLHYWLAETLVWQARHDEQLRVAEQGLALLEDDVESVEAALMNIHLASGQADVQKGREIVVRAASIGERLPYTPDLRTVFTNAAAEYALHCGDMEQGMYWLQALEKRAGPIRDLKALAEVGYFSARSIELTGDLSGAIRRGKEGLEHANLVGDRKIAYCCCDVLARVHLQLGDLQVAEEYAHRRRALARNEWLTLPTGFSRFYLGQIAVCQAEWRKAGDAFEHDIEVTREINDHRGAAYALFRLGALYLARGDARRALKHFAEACALAGPGASGLDTILLASLLSGLEQAHRDPGIFRAFCQELVQEYPELRNEALKHWFLEPAAAGVASQRPARREAYLHYDTFVDPLSPSWEWVDPFGDCSFTTQNGLELRAVNGRDLWYVNQSAPRMLQPVLLQRRCAVQTVCGPVSAEKPAIGGLLLWKDKENYLRLDRGTRGPAEISFQGRVGKRDLIIGRGQLGLGASGREPRGASSRKVMLRLEWDEGLVQALCSRDGVEWFSLGSVEFSGGEPLQVGLHAIGDIARTFYPGAHRDGTAIRFESFQLWEM